MTLIADMADRGELIETGDVHDTRFMLEVDTDERRATIVFTEVLAFHAEYNGPQTFQTPGFPTVTTEGKWTPLVDEDGFLTHDAETALAGRLSAMMPSAADGSAVFIADSNDDEPNVVIEITTDYTDGETYESWLDRIGWPIVATLINVTDPGTFNSPYLFDATTLTEA